MKTKNEFHIRADESKTKMAKQLSGLNNRELFELGCQTAIEQNQNILDREIRELNDTIERVNELTASIKIRLQDKEVPTKPKVISENNEDEIKRNILPLEFFQEILLYYMDDFGVNDVEEINNKNKEIFRFILINISHHNINIEDINSLYAKFNKA